MSDKIKKALLDQAAENAFQNGDSRLANALYDEAEKTAAEEKWWNQPKNQLQLEGVAHRKRMHEVNKKRHKEFAERTSPVGHSLLNDEKRLKQYSSALKKVMKEINTNSDAEHQKLYKRFHAAIMKNEAEWAKKQPWPLPKKLTKKPGLLLGQIVTGKIFIRRQPTAWRLDPHHATVGQFLLCRMQGFALIPVVLLIHAVMLQ